MTDLFDKVATLLEVDYQDNGRDGVSMEDLPSREINTALQTRDESALLGLADNGWVSQDVQGMHDASQQVGMVGQPGPGSIQW